MNPSKNTDRMVKSINFTDRALLDYASLRAESMYGGNFSSYILALVERDRSQPEANRTLTEFADKVCDLVRRYKGKPAKSESGCDFFIQELQVIIEAKARFPRDRVTEYKMLGAIHDIAVRNPSAKFVLVYPDELPVQEKERFLTISTLGYPLLHVLSYSKLGDFLQAESVKKEASQSSGINL